MNTNPTVLTATAHNLGDSISLDLDVKTGAVDPFEATVNLLAVVALNHARSSHTDPESVLDDLLDLAREVVTLNRTAPVLIKGIDGEDDD